jgi:hypothetical protein
MGASAHKRGLKPGNSAVWLVLRNLSAIHPLCQHAALHHGGVKLPELVRIQNGLDYVGGLLFLY